jgi:hypothetical protein
MTSQGSAHGRFQRAIRDRHLRRATMAARELWYLARVMGTSTVHIDDTYARWLKRTDDQLRAAFNDYDAARASSSGSM